MLHPPLPVARLENFKVIEHNSLNIEFQPKAIPIDFFIEYIDKNGFNNFIENLVALPKARLVVIFQQRKILIIYLLIQYLCLKI